jgi:hypothetical protein
MQTFPDIQLDCDSLILSQNAVREVSDHEYTFRRVTPAALAKIDIIEMSLLEPMPEKRGEVVEKVDASQMMPDIFEKWLENQRSTHVHAKAGFMAEWKLGEGEEEAKEEDKIDIAETAHEKAKRRKKGKRTR